MEKPSKELINLQSATTNTNTNNHAVNLTPFTPNEKLDISEFTPTLKQVRGDKLQSKEADRARTLLESKIGETAVFGAVATRKTRQ